MSKLTTVLPSSKDEAASGWPCWTGGGSSSAAPAADSKAVAPCWVVGGWSCAVAAAVGGGAQSCAPLLNDPASIAACGWGGKSYAVEAKLPLSQLSAPASDEGTLKAMSGELATWIQLSSPRTMAAGGKADPCGGRAAGGPPLVLEPAPRAFGAFGGKGDASE